MTAMLSLLRTYRSHWRAIAVILVLLVVGAVLETTALLLLVPIATAVTTGSNELNQSIAGVTISADASDLVFVSIGCVLLGLLARLATVYLQTRLVVAVERNQRARIYDGFLYATWQTQTAEPPGRFQWATNLTAGYAALLGVLLNSTKFVINVATMLVAAVVVSPIGALSILLVGIALYAALQPLLRSAKRANRRMLAAAKSQNQAVAETVVLSGQIKSYGVSGRYWRRLMGITREVLREKRTAQLLAGVVTPIYQATALLIALAILAYATFQPVDVPALGAVALLLLRSLSSAQGIQTAFVRYAELRPVLENLEEWNTVYAENRESSGDVRIDRVDTIDVEHVSFSYAGDEDALRQTSVSLAAGDDLGLMGPSGAGKSTLAQILLRFRTPTEGRYLVNGHSAADISADCFAREVAYVPQTPLIMRGTVHDNVTMFRDGIARDRVIEAARRAGVHEWIERLPNGYDTVIGPDTHGFSGGQAQRLSIARALAGTPSLLVLDEPTSALDVDSEELVTAALQGLPEHVIVVLIAHRMSTLRHCNRVMVLEDGKVTAVGTSAETLAENAFFRRAVAAGAFTPSA